MAAMELEGCGVSMVGKTIWSYGAGIPWEFLQGTPFVMRILVRSEACQGEVETDWNTVWTPTTTKDWSLLASILRSTAGPILIAFDQCKVPQAFWTYFDGIQRTDHRFTRVWIHKEEPQFTPDAVFVPPGCSEALQVFQTLPGRGGHGPWQVNGDTWPSILAATTEQELGLVVSDVAEHEWMLMWYKPLDSLQVLGSFERRVARISKYLSICSSLLKN
jgi:hypothetical protein